MPQLRRLIELKERFGRWLYRADIVRQDRWFIFFDGAALRDVCRHVYEEWNGRYVVTVGIDDRLQSGTFWVAHNFALDRDQILLSFLFKAPPGEPTFQSIQDFIPGAEWGEREATDLLGIRFVGGRHGRLVLPADWPDGVYPLRKEVPWNFQYKPAEQTDPPLVPEHGAMVLPLGPFHPVLDEPELFRLFVEGERVIGCEYRGFMVHRGIEKLGESVLTYDDIPMVAERICGICGCVHNVAYAQAVECAAGIEVPQRAEYIRTIFLELERLHSHLLWVGLAGHILGFDTLFMHAFRIREPIMWIAEKLSGNRKTYGLCLIGGVRWDISDSDAEELGRVLEKIEKEWHAVSKVISKDKNIKRRTVGVGVADASLVRRYGLLGPVARAAGIDIDCRRDHPYAAYDKVKFDVVTCEGGDVWARLMVRTYEVFESIKIIKQCLTKMEHGPIRVDIPVEPPPGRYGMSSVEAPRGESHHFIITGQNNRPHRWRVRAPSYQNLQAIPEMVRGGLLPDMAIALGSIDPCFSCTDRLEVVDLSTGKVQVITRQELEMLSRAATEEQAGI